MGGLRYAATVLLVLGVTFVAWRWISADLGLSIDQRIALAGPCLGSAALVLAAAAVYAFRASIEGLTSRPRLRVMWHADEEGRSNGHLRFDPSGTTARAVLPAGRSVWLHLPFAVLNEGTATTSNYRLELLVPPALNRRIHTGQTQPTVALTRPARGEGGHWLIESSVDRPGGCRFTFDSDGERPLYPGWPRVEGRLDLWVAANNPIPPGRYAIGVRIAADGMPIRHGTLGLEVRQSKGPPKRPSLVHS